MVPSATLDAAVREVEQFCEQRVPEERRGTVRLEAEVRGSAITLVERRPPWSEDVGSEWTSQPIAKLRYDGTSATWSLHWPRPTGRWVRYDGVPAATHVRALLAVIDADPDGVFWG